MLTIFKANLVEEYLNEEFRNRMIENIESKSNEIDQRLNYLNLWIWIAKALVLREHRLFTILTNKVMNFDKSRKKLFE